MREAGEETRKEKRKKENEKLGCWTKKKEEKKEKEKQGHCRMKKKDENGGKREKTGKKMKGLAGPGKGCGREVNFF